MQIIVANKPLKLVTDVSEAHMTADMASFMRGYKINFNKNQLNGSLEGGNMGVATGNNSTVRAVPTLLLPAGNNKCVGSRESIELNQVYYMNWNENGAHGIYRINGNDLTAEIVLISSKLNFSNDPKHFIAAHRISIKPVYNSIAGNSRDIKEIELKWTDALNWQGWINVQGAIATGGFNATTFPYFKLQYPHYDFEELFQWAVRPIMFCPLVKEVPVDGLSLGKANQLENKSVQFAVVALLTDGRSTTLSPFSTPYSYKKAGCATNAAGSVRCLNLTLNVGSAHVEALQLLVRNCGGDWKLYDTIKKYKNSGVNDPAVIGNKYWLRTNPWSDFTYNAENNTIEYNYCGDKECAIYSADDAIRFQSDLPILSTALTDAGDACLLSDNLYGYRNLSQDILDKIDLEVVHDDASASCPVKTVEIKIYAILSREAQYTVPQFVWNRSEEDTDYRFGGCTYAPNVNVPAMVEVEESDRFNLKLNGRSGFVCYLAGTSYYSVGKQFLIRNGAREDVGVININNAEDRAIYNDIVKNRNGYFCQEFIFNVPAGNYIARIAGHDVDIDAAYQKTSTYVGGVFARNNSVGANLGNVGYSKELVVEACSGDVDYADSSTTGTFYIFVPWARNYGSGLNDQDFGRFITGYLTERSSDNIPVESVYYDRTNGGSPYIQQGRFTDHNGFFWSMSAGGNAQNSQVGFFPKLNCAEANTSGSPRFTTNIAGSNTGFYPGQDKTIEGSIGGAYGACNRIIVKGSIKDCDSQNGLGGVAVTLEGSATYYTNSEGNFELIIHSPSNGSRTGRIFYNGNGSCNVSSCDCSCITPDNYDEALSPCVNCNERNYPTLFDKNFKVVGQIKPSLKNGGRYAVSVAVHDLAGRSTFANRIGYVEIPTIMEYGSISPSSIAWSLSGPLNIPKEFKYLTFFITKNLNNARYLEWVGDKIEFLDINGDVAPSGNGAVLAKISIQSLLDYNVNNNFSVNTIYQFSAGDRIRFIDNGEGDLLGTTENGFLDFVIRGTNFDTITDTNTDETEDGKSILIDYDSRLLQLKDKCSFWIELISPRACEDLERHFEICGTYPIVNGQIAVSSGKLNAFDTYFINRDIVVPECTKGSQTHPFESASISDFYGTGCDSSGRFLVVNEKAEQRWYKDDTIKSDDAVNEGLINGLGTFRESNRKAFKGSEWGGIVAIKAERGVVLFVCENDFFLASYEQNFVRTTTTGILLADLNTNLSDPNQKVGDNFGCSFEDTAAICFFDGMGMWPDSKNGGITFTDFRVGADVSRIENKSWFINKFKYVKEFNRKLSAVNYLKNLIEITAGIDPQGRKYYISFRPRNGLTGRDLDFVNNEYDFFVDAQETMIYDIDAKVWVGSAPFVPEAYSMLRDSISGIEMISFANGKPHFHNTKKVKTVNEVYGVKTDEVFEVVFGKDDEGKEKLFQSLMVDSRGPGFYISRVMTNMPNLLSYVPVPYLVKKANVYDVSLLRNMNIYQEAAHPVASTLIDGGPVTGQWTKIQFVKDTKKRDIYSEVNYIWMRYIPVEKSKK